MIKITLNDDEEFRFKKEANHFNHYIINQALVTNCKFQDTYWSYIVMAVLIYIMAVCAFFSGILFALPELSHTLYLIIVPIVMAMPVIAAFYAIHVAKIPLLFRAIFIFKKKCEYLCEGHIGYQLQTKDGWVNVHAPSFHVKTKMNVSIFYEDPFLTKVKNIQFDSEMRSDLIVPKILCPGISSEVRDTRIDQLFNSIDLSAGRKNTILNTMHSSAQTENVLSFAAALAKADYHWRNANINKSFSNFRGIH